MKKIIIFLFIIATIIIGYFIFQIIIYILAPDVPIGTPPEIERIIKHTLPQNYEIKSIRSVQKISEFEGVRTPFKWLQITLKNKTITSEKELFNIAKPICSSIANKGYEGVDIGPHSSTIQNGASCEIWGP